ncbi:MAG TPA: hypothetical protein VGD99_24955 [Anaerolineae bacterium]
MAPPPFAPFGASAGSPRPKRIRVEIKPQRCNGRSPKPATWAEPVHRLAQGCR